MDSEGFRTIMPGTTILSRIAFKRLGVLATQIIIRNANGQRIMIWCREPFGKLTVDGFNNLLFHYKYPDDKILGIGEESCRFFALNKVRYAFDFYWKPKIQVARSRRN